VAARHAGGKAGEFGIEKRLTSSIVKMGGYETN
jgi:hypothetical protein